MTALHGGTRSVRDQGKEGRRRRHFTHTVIVNSPELTIPIRHKNGTSYDGTAALNTYQFDHRNRLVSVLGRNPGGVVTQTVAFVYDAMNRRLSKTVNGPQNTSAVRFLYNQDDSWADLDGTNAVTARYLHGARIDELLARQRVSDGRGWYLTDHLGTVRDIANAAGAVVAHVDYSSFGQVLGVSNPGAVDRFLFTGRELDMETGLYFYRARYYSTQIGLFLGQDPIGFAAGDLNLYRYVENGVLYRTDPYGTEIVEYLNNLSIRLYVVAETRFIGLAIRYRFICTAIAIAVTGDRIEADRALRELAGLLGFAISSSDTLSFVLKVLNDFCGQIPDPFCDPLNFGDQGGRPGCPPYGAR